MNKLEFQDYEKAVEFLKADYIQDPNTIYIEHSRIKKAIEQIARESEVFNIYDTPFTISETFLSNYNNFKDKASLFTYSNNHFQEKPFHYFSTNSELLMEYDKEALCEYVEIEQSLKMSEADYKRLLRETFTTVVINIEFLANGGFAKLEAFTKQYLILLKKWFKADPETAYTANRVLEDFIESERRNSKTLISFYNNHSKTYFELLPVLKELDKNFDPVTVMILCTIGFKEKITKDQWINYIENYSHYKDMPVEWWSKLI